MDGSRGAGKIRTRQVAGDGTRDDAFDDALSFVLCGGAQVGKRTLLRCLISDCAGSSNTKNSDEQKAEAASSGQFGPRDFVPPFEALRSEKGPDAWGSFERFSGKSRDYLAAIIRDQESQIRELAVDGSQAALAVLLVDASVGVTIEARRDCLILSLLGVGHVVFVVNKMDLVEWDKVQFGSIADDLRKFAAKLGNLNISVIPASALTEDNIARKSAAMQWYQGPALLEHLDSLSLPDGRAAATFRMPVQWIYGTDEGVRGCTGVVASGAARIGDQVAILPSGHTATIGGIVAAEDTPCEAVAGRTVTVTLADDAEVGRGDLIAAAQDRPTVANQFAAHLVWLAEQPLLPGRQYLLRLGPLSTGAQVTELKYKINIDTLEHAAGKHLDPTEIGFCNFALDRALPFDPYAANPATGGFTVVDRLTNAVVGFGMIAFPLRRALNVHWQHTDVDKAQRASLMGQAPCLLWLTGLSGSGKSTVANIVERKLIAMGRHTYLLDGDNVRHGLSKDLGFTDEDRVENIRRVAECAKLFVDAGLIVLTAFISPFRAERRMARDLIQDGEFFEIFIDTPLEICERRDPKGLYRKARAGELPNFTGIDSPYERPASAELILDGATLSAEEMADRIIEVLVSRKMC